VRVRRALAHAVDRKAFIDGAQEGLGKPIGSHFAPTDLGYLDLTKTYPYDPEKAKALLKEAGVTTPLNLTLTPAAAALRTQGRRDHRGATGQGGHQRQDRKRRMGAVAGRPFKGNFDLTIINHVEPLDYATAYANPDYYFGYDSAKFRGLVATLAATSEMKEKARPVARHPAPAGRRRGQRLHLEPGPGGGVQEGAARPVEQLADLRQRHGGRELGAAKG
jgi:peptide/nickel transport system substrate-binding protein